MAFNPFGMMLNMAKKKLTQKPLGASLFGGSEAGQKATGLTPDFLKGAAGAGDQLGEFFAQAFGNLGSNLGLNTALSQIGQNTANRARTARTGGKFSGSPIGEALAQGIQTQGAGLEQQARVQDQASKLQQGLGLAQGFTGAVTNPLMNILGLQMGADQSQQALAEQARQFNKSQPSSFDKILGAVSGVFCWVAREVLQDDRWLAARQYMLHEAPEYTKRLYAEHGEALADRVKHSPELRNELRPVFEEFARRGNKYLRKE